MPAEVVCRPACCNALPAKRTTPAAQVQITCSQVQRDLNANGEEKHSGQQKPGGIEEMNASELSRDALGRERGTPKNSHEEQHKVRLQAHFQLLREYDGWRPLPGGHAANCRRTLDAWCDRYESWRAQETAPASLRCADFPSLSGLQIPARRPSSRRGTVRRDTNLAASHHHLTYLAESTHNRCQPRTCSRRC